LRFTGFNYPSLFIKALWPLVIYRPANIVTAPRNCNQPKVSPRNR
jgi:hypothetical protein